MNRRGFLGAILAASAAPAIVRADSLMRVVVRPSGVLTWGFDEFYLDHAEIICPTEYGWVETNPLILWTPERRLELAKNVVANNAILKRVRAAKPFTGGYVVEGRD